MKQWLKTNPWIWIVIWFAMVFILWGWFIPFSKTIGMTPVPVELEK